MTRNIVDRRFRVSEATATLPLVRRIVADIKEDSRELDAVLPRLKQARIESRRAGSDVRDLESLRNEVAEITTRFEGYLAELAQIGCLYRGSTGHVDFRSEVEGQPVFLCWLPEESTVRHRHALGLDCRHREPIGVLSAAPLVGS